MGQVLKTLTSLGDPNSKCLSIYGHQVSDLAVFIANVFMLGYAVEATVQGYTAKEQCEYPLDNWIVAQSVMIFILQIFTPLLLVVPRTPNVLAPVFAAALFLAQWVLLFIGWDWILAPSNCPTTAPFLYGGSYWTLVVYSVAVPLETVWYIRMYQRVFQDPYENIQGGRRFPAEGV